MGSPRTRADVVIDLLRLKVWRRRGTRAWIFCPLHHSSDAKDPTFFVRVGGERSGQFHCFSCKSSGDLAELVSRLRNVDREEARRLVKTALDGWEAPRARARVVARPARLGRRRFHLPAGVIEEPIEAWVSGARSYAESRGITAEIARRYRVGYAVDGRLAGRIVFPALTGPRAEAASYSARSFVGDEPKYLTPSEDEEPDLDAMFGEHLWPAAADRRAVVVTEGAIDAMSVGAASGLPHAAIGGSDVRPGHVVSLSTFPVVLIATDDDAPGERAARALRSALGRSCRTERVRLARDANATYLDDPGRLRDAVLGAAARHHPER